MGAGAQDFAGVDVVAGVRSARSEGFYAAAFELYPSFQLIAVRSTGADVQDVVLAVLPQAVRRLRHRGPSTRPWLGLAGHIDAVAGATLARHDMGEAAEHQPRRIAFAVLPEQGSVQARRDDPSSAGAGES